MLAAPVFSSKYKIPVGLMEEITKKVYVVGRSQLGLSRFCLTKEEF